MNTPLPGGRSVVVVTNQTSPYQVEYMNALARDTQIALKVIYLHSERPGRQWVQLPLEHRHLIVDGNPDRLGEARKWLLSTDFAVIGYYNDAFAHHLLSCRAGINKPWCFWGERMGASSLAWAGPIVRRWKLRALHKSPAAIWGIGKFALSRYRQEFGPGRPYYSVPYFSDLHRFAVSEPRPPARNRVILYSGSLVKRKGVDILAAAFREVAPLFPHLRLVFLGQGEEAGRLATQLSSCQSQVDFVGFRSWSELPHAYKRADILCAPSRHDGWGLAVAEGLAAGLPVISTNRTGAALDLVQDEINGWVVASQDTAALAEALTKSASLSQEALQTMANAATASVASHQLSDGVKLFERAVEQSLATWRSAETMLGG